MSSRDSTTPNSSSNLLHQFLVTDSIPNSNQFHSHFLNACQNEDHHHHQHHPFGQVPTIQSLGERMSTSLDLIHPSDLLEASNTEAGGHQQHSHSHHGVGPYVSEMLSLSLSSEMLFRPIQLRQRQDVDYYSFAPPPLSSNFLNQTSSSSSSDNTNTNTNSNSYGVQSFTIGMISNSRYLKPTQSLLQEVVCVGGVNVQSSNERYFNRMSSKSRRGSFRFCSELKSDTLRNDSNGFQTLGKLIALLQEVERRYEQYYKELEKVVSSFEMVAGIGAGKCYTALALQAMSKHFCSLRDAITFQIMETRRKIMNTTTTTSDFCRFQEEEEEEGKENNRMCLKQLGMVQSQQPQAWKPIRGLPEVSVSILRCWLFEHFLHPYPNDNEKLTLASQTGLTKNQVSNWFINARVRLWKPMIEEMYREEFDGDAYVDSSSTQHDQD